MLIRLGVAALWLLRFLPASILARIGRGAGMLMYYSGAKPRRVAHANIELCFPELSKERRRQLLVRHFQAFGRSLLEYGILWWSSQERIQRLVKIRGIEYWQSLGARPVIWLAPHFVGLDAGGARLATEFHAVSTYGRQHHAVLDSLLMHGRTRFGTAILLSRRQSARQVIKLMREGRPFYYLPDQDLGPRFSIFVPFFGIPAATVTGLSRIVRLTGAAVVPCITRQLAEGYEVQFYPAWQDFPGATEEADARRMNAFIEERIREMPEQYFWTHKRFRTRPEGEPSLYR
ncbi:MAG TPA: lipid A biosynthesis acyltransferase [Burkholderiales bacterium]|nr:lipid A biosynthesis acyltransferase [Burkholderiales bacterium]